MPHGGRRLAVTRRPVPQGKIEEIDWMDNKDAIKLREKMVRANGIARHPNACARLPGSDGESALPFCDRPVS